MLRFSLPILLLFLIACGSPDQQTEDASSIVGTEVTYSVDTLTMHGYLAYDESIEGQRPGVLVVHEWWGHNAYARKRADMLAGMGYTSLAVDMYGEGKTADHPDDAGKFASMVMQNMESAETRFVKAMEILKNDPHTDPEQIAAIGYCFGGGVVLNMAFRGVDLDGVASFHGMLPTPDSLGEVHAELLVCHGADDAFISDSTVVEFKQIAKENNIPLRFESYEGAVHSFTNPAADSLGREFEMGIAYNARADTASWQALEQFLDRIF